MPVSIDTVYQRVLALANKEQRGYITPQEFNLFANQAQMDIFEQYFYDINQFERVPDNNTEYSDIVDLINEKLSVFKISRPQGATFNSTFQQWTLAPNCYKLGDVFVGGEVADEVDYNEYIRYSNSPLASPTTTYPVYVRQDVGDLSGIEVFPTNTSNVRYTFVRRPDVVRWGYIVVNEKPLHDATSSTHFELHAAEETKLVLKILILSGITLNKPMLTRQAASLDIQKIQQEKQ